MLTFVPRQVAYEDLFVSSFYSVELQKMFCWCLELRDFNLSLPLLSVYYSTWLALHQPLSTNTSRCQLHLCPIPPHPTCSYHDVGAGEQPDLHGLATAVDHASSHPQRCPECPWARHGQEKQSTGSEHHIRPGRGAAAQRRQTTLQLRQPHHICYQQLAKEEDDTERDLSVDLWQLSLLQGGREWLEGKRKTRRKAQTVASWLLWILKYVVDLCLYVSEVTLAY